jgi:hypothetical protein
MNFNWELFATVFVAGLLAMIVWSFVTTTQLNPDNTISTNVIGMGGDESGSSGGSSKDDQ